MKVFQSRQTFWRQSFNNLAWIDNRSHIITIRKKYSNILSSFQIANEFQFVNSIIVIEHFRQQRENFAISFSVDETIVFEKNCKIDFIIEQKLNKRRVFYTREIKFDVVNFWIIAKNAKDEQFNAYLTTKKFDITFVMLKKWIKQKNEIEILKKNVRKNKIVKCQKFEFENRFIELFFEIRNNDFRINKKWFMY